MTRSKFTGMAFTVDELDATTHVDHAYVRVEAPDGVDHFDCFGGHRISA